MASDETHEGGATDLAVKDASPLLYERQDVYHGTFLPSGQVLTGGENGRICLWEKNAVRQEFDGHDGPIKVMRLRADNTTLVTAGADGHVRVWTVHYGQDLGMPFSLEPMRDLDLYDPDAAAEGIPPQVFTSLDITLDDSDDTIVAADDNNDIWELSYMDDDPPRIMVRLARTLLPALSRVASVWLRGWACAGGRTER